MSITLHISDTTVRTQKMVAETTQHHLKCTEFSHLTRFDRNLVYNKQRSVMKDEEEQIRLGAIFTEISFYHRQPAVA